MGFQQDLQVAVRKKFSPVSYITSIAPARYGARYMTASFSDEVGFNERSNGDFDTVLNFARNSTRMREIRNHLPVYGLDTDVSLERRGPRLFCKFYFSKYRGFKEHLQELNEMNRKAGYTLLGQPDKNAKRAMIREATLLDYPECCTERYVEEHSRFFGDRARSPETRINQQLKAHVIKNGSEPEINPSILPVFFCFEFYPCDPECPEAAKVGNRIMDIFESTDPDLANVYRLAQRRAALQMFLPKGSEYNRFLQESERELLRAAGLQQSPHI